MLEGGLQSAGDVTPCAAGEVSVHHGGVGGAAAAGAMNVHGDTAVPSNDASMQGGPADDPPRRSSRFTGQRAAEGSAGAVVRRRQMR